jgi:surface protein
MALPINDTLNIKVTNNTNLPQKVNMLGGTQDPLGVPPHKIYQWDLSTETYFGSVVATIVISSTSNPTPVTYSVQVNGYTIQAVVFALNSLNKGLFQSDGTTIYVSNDFYIYGILTVGSTIFTSTWDTTLISANSSANNQIQLPLISGGNYNFTVDWGDGSQDIITSWNQVETLHTYAVAGIYTLNIVGTITEWSFGNSVVADVFKILSISSWGLLQFGTIIGKSFINCVNLDLSMVSDVPNLSASNTFFVCFGGCSSLTSINRLNEWNTVNITNMSNMFSGCYLFNGVLGSWNVSSVQDMSYMFISAYVFNSNINSWDVSNVANMYAMFVNAKAFNSPLNSWNVSSVTDMSSMFSSAFAFNQPLNSWNTISLNKTELTFKDAIAFNQPLNSWNMSSVTKMRDMFNGATNFNGNLNDWDTSAVTDMTNIFADAISFNKPINLWNVSNVQFMGYMFYGATSFNQPLNSWNIILTTEMESMFLNAIAFNQPLNLWNVTSVIRMGSMFENAIAFNQDISSWNISNVSDFNNFMIGKTDLDYSATYLDAIYNTWSTLSVQPNLFNVNFGGIKYTLAGQAGKNILLGSPSNWQIFDGGI